jgi:hypothetical protein
VHMLKRGDENATTLLHAITVHCLCIDQVLMWWYQTKLVASGHWHLGNAAQRGQCSQSQLQRGSANTLCEEIVRLWKLAALNPKLNAFERDQLAILLRIYHHTAVERILRLLKTLKNVTSDQSLSNDEGMRLSTENAPFNVQFFPGFFSALQVCHLDWSCSTIRTTCQKVGAAEFCSFLEVSVLIANSPTNSFRLNASKMNKTTSQSVSQSFDMEPNAWLKNSSTPNKG